MATGRIGVTPTLRTRWSKAPSGGTTSLSGLDDNSVSLVYDVGYEAVYRNGVLLSRTNDYTATSGTSITLIDATITGDIIEVFANQLVPLTDAISKGQYSAKAALLSASAASTPAVLTVGANDTVLTADSTQNTGLKWATPSTAKSYSLLSTTTTNTGTSFTISSLSGYDEIRVLFHNIRTNDTGNNQIRLQLNADTTTANYRQVGWSMTVPSTMTSVVISDPGLKLCNHGTATDNDLNGYAYIAGANTSGVKLITQGTAVSASGSALGLIVGGTYTSSSVISSITLITAGGAFTGGTMYVYGAA